MIRFWYWFCLLFLINNIGILIEESYQVIYKISNRNESIQYLNCIHLSQIFPNKTRIDLNEIKNDFNYGLRWIQKNRKDRCGKRISNETIENILNQTKSSDYLIYQNRICFIFNNSYKINLFSKLSFKFPIDSTYFIFNNNTFSFFRLNCIFNYFEHIKVNHKETPYSDCTKDYLNFKCLNEKIKRIQRLSRYYYGSDENGSIELNYQINQTIIDNEVKAIKECNQIDCNINIFYPSSKYSNSTILKSFLSIPKFDFYFQLIGLIALFLNISIYKLIILIINFIHLRPVKIKLLKSKIIKKIFMKSKLNLLKGKYLKINYLILSITLISLLILFNRSISNFIQERDYPSMKKISINSIRSELSIAICIPIKMIKGNDYNIYNRSLLELENDTDDGLNIKLKDIYLQFLNKKISTKWQLESKLIAFYRLSRCFQLRIILNEPKYQSIFSVTQLVIEFDKIEYLSIYILTDNELFNSKSYEHSLSYNFRMKIFKRSKLNKNKKCKNFNLVDDNCISKWDCIDQCTNREIYNRFKNFTYYIIINKKYHTDEEWSKLFIKPVLLNRLIIEYKIRIECINKYSEFDTCIDIEFESYSNINYKYNNKRVIDFNYKVIYYKEEEPLIFKLLLDLLNIQINLFGLNFYNLSFMILSLLKLRLIKFLKLLIYLICSIGFVYHLWSIYDEIINIEIIYSEHYELINSIQIPDLIFCFDLNKTKLDLNHKLTYEYLDKITSDELIEDKIFNRIEYLNESNNWIRLDNKTNFKDNNLEIKTFYYLNRKCFKIIQNIEYNRNQFEFNNMETDNNLVLKILFNRIYLDDKIFYFFTKTKHKFQFSKIQQLNLKNDYNYKSYKIKHETTKRDEFELIKNPLFFNNENQNNLDEFFNKFINYFETKTNFVTFKLPFEKTNLNLKKEINDNLFIQLYDQQNHNFRHHFRHHFRQNSNNYVDSYVYYNLNDLILIPDFKFNLSFYRKVIVVSNKISLIKLIINLLNVLAFWFNLGILDLFNYICMIKLLPLQLYKLLIKIKNKLIIFSDHFY